ncbi:hypothetical protein [Modestobacter sp. SYSU DS0875]
MSGAVLAALTAAVATTVVSCTGDPEQAAAPSTSGGLPPALVGSPWLQGTTELLQETGRGSASFQVPDVGDAAALVFTISCTDDETPARLGFVLASGRDDYLMSSAGCGGYAGRTPPLDLADPPTMLQVTVPVDAEYTVWVYGTPVSG